MASKSLLVHKQHSAACELAKEWKALSNSLRRNGRSLSKKMSHRYEDTVSRFTEPSLRETPGSRTFATIGVDLYHTLIQGTSELIRGTCPDGVRDPGDDPGDGRADRLAERGVGVFSRGLSSRHEGSTRGNRGGRSGFSAGVRVCF